MSENLTSEQSIPEQSIPEQSIHEQSVSAQSVSQKFLSELEILRSVWEDRKFVTTLIVVGVILHLLNIWFIRHTPDFNVPIIDSLDYVNGAEAVLNGQKSAYGFFHSPLYLFLVAVIFKLTGSSLLAVRLFQILFSVLSAILLYAIAARVFSKSTARVALILLTFYGPLIIYDTAVLNTSLVIFLNLLALALTIQAWDAPSRYSWLAAGVAIGLAATARPDILAFAVVLACAVGWLIFKRRLPMQSAINVAGLAIGVGVMLAVVGMTSLVLSGHFTVLPGGSAINFYVGNNPDYRSTIGIRPASWNRIVDLSVIEENTGSAESGTFYYRKALGFIKGQPVAYLGDLLFKVRTLVNGYELPDVLDLYTSSRHNPIMSLLVWRTAWFAFPYGLLLPLALIGIFITRHALARTWLLLAMMGSMLASLIGYWNVSRYRMSIVPILIMFAAESLVWLWSRRSSFAFRPAFVPACIVAGVVIITNFPYDHFSKSYNYQAEAYTLAGDTLSMKGHAQQAVEFLSQGVALDPNNAYNHWKLGSTFLKSRQAELAAPELQTAVNIDPSSYRAQYELGVALSINGNHEGALEAFTNSINANQTFYPPYPDLAREYARGGQLKQAATYFSKALELNPGDPYVYNDVGVLLIKQNKTKEAIGFFSQAVDLAPGFEMAKRNLEMAKQGAPGTAK